MSMPKLIIADITLPERSRLDFQQTYEPILGGARRRMANGSLFSMTHWKKWKTTIRGSGWVPAPLLGIDYSSAYFVHCIEPIALRPGEDLPPGWSARTDWPEVILPADAHGVSVRLVLPILRVMSDPPTFSPGMNPTWELICEEA